MPFHPLKITAITRETEDAITLAFDIPPNLKEAYAFTPGQYLTLRTTIDGQETRRAYSICSPANDPHPRIAIKRVEQGRFSTHAHQALAQGQTIDVMTPEGRFTLPQATTPRTILAIAAGSGITPILSILASTLETEPQTSFNLLYGSRTTASILFRDELEALKDRFMTRLAITHILSREQQDIPILNGRLDAAKLAALHPTPPDLALLCGPTPLIEAATQALQHAGLPSTAIRSERFTLDGQPTPPPTPRPKTQTQPPHATATIIADGISTQIPINPNEPVLDAALRAGLDLPWSCRAGMCSTCRARLTQGHVTMTTNYGLEPWETDAGYVLTCQSHPTTNTVTLDYDHV